jgi:hypothetical protein
LAGAWLATVWLLQETVVATATFTNRESLELFAKLGLHVLPHWLGIRQGVQRGRPAGRQGSTLALGTAARQLYQAVDRKQFNSEGLLTRCALMQLKQPIT